jgi:hypothetical protein
VEHDWEGSPIPVCDQAAKSQRSQTDVGTPGKLPKRRIEDR